MPSGMGKALGGATDVVRDRGGAERPHSVAQGPAELGAALHEQARDGVGEVVLSGLDPLPQERRHGLGVGVVVVVEAVVQGQGGQAVFVGGGAGGEVAAEAVAEQDEPVGVDLGAGQRVVDHGGDHGLPVRAEDQCLLAQRRNPRTNSACSLRRTTRGSTSTSPRSGSRTWPPRASARLPEPSSRASTALENIGTAVTGENDHGRVLIGNRVTRASRP